MTWSQLIRNFEKKDICLDEAEVERIESVFRYRKFRKSQYILQQGDVSRYETYILSGLARTYLVNDKGQEHVISFNPEDYWVGDLCSLYTGNPTNYNIDCLEETEVLQVTKAELERLFTDVPKLNIFYRILYRNSIIAYNMRVGSALSKTAMERYTEFLEKYPSIDQRVPNHQVASFLGITPQSLSRLRKQFMEKKL
jgi:CRP-like cAMP-binding protein